MSTQSIAAAPLSIVLLAENDAAHLRDAIAAWRNEAEKLQRLHLAFGGELKALDGREFADPSKLGIVGLFPDLASAPSAWRAKAQQIVGNAHARYFGLHRRRLIAPELTPAARVA